VKYCNAACKKKHRTKHKKACERRVAELHEEALFKEHPPNEECPICFLPHPHDEKRPIFHSCCGKVICMGCMYTMRESEGVGLCPFCRTPHATSNEEMINQTKILMGKGNAYAYHHLAGRYAQGIRGLPQDRQKANELYLKAGELGCADAYFNLGIVYACGEGVEVDIKKSKHYFELAAMGGNAEARQNLGALEGRADNWERAVKHWSLAARAGYKKSLDQVKKGYKLGLVTKDEYANTLRAYHERQKEMKSDARVKAAAS